MSIVVLGSFMMDLVTKTSRMPELGETLMGESFHVNGGGKGANQAATIARLGEHVHFCGKVGNDAYGNEALKLLQNEQVNVDYLLVDQAQTTGIGNVMVDHEGNNKIVIIPGANLEYTIEEFSSIEMLIAKSKLLVLQLEMSYELTRHAIEFAYNHQIPILLNPAPARVLEDEILNRITYLTPNESELELISGIKIMEDYSNVEMIMKMIQQKGVKNVIVTLGERGAVWLDEDANFTYHPGYRVEATDTVAAGDSFNGALACGIVSGKNIETTLTLCNAVGALTVTKPGAIASLPSKAEVELFISKQQNPSI